MKLIIIKKSVFAVLCAASLNAAAADCSYTIGNEWATGFVGSITITNTESSVIDGWQVGWSYSDGSSVVSSWTATVSGNNPYQAEGLVWNSQIQPGNSVSFGLQGLKGTEGSAAEIPEISGSVCSGGVNTAPTAEFSVTDNVGLARTFDASNSSDDQNDELTYSWSFDDGASYSTVNPQHTFAAEGTYIVTLTVSDGEAIDTAEQSIEITDIPENGVPVANMTFFIDGRNVTFDGSTSSDPENESLSYSWNFGDGATREGVSANHNYAVNGLYSVTLTVSDGLDSATTSVDVTVEGDAPGVTHVANPFLGAAAYVNADYATLVDGSIALETDVELKEKMAKLKMQPTAVWLDRIDAIYGGDVNSGRLSLEQHFEQALLQQQDGVPMTVNIVVYNLPDRDCAALASNGTLHADKNGLEIYKRDYIDVIADIASDPRFKELRIIAVLEPDSLPNLVTNMRVLKCGMVGSNGTYVKGVQYAISRLAQLDNVYTYLDIAHSGWLGWVTNLTGAVNLYTDVVAGVADGDMTVLDGFISNVSNYTPSEEVFLPDPEFDFDGDYMGIKSSSYYEWNPVFDEKYFAELLHAEFVANGFPQELAMLIDTSRNGWGGSDRPESDNIDAANEDDYVLDSKLDRREHRGNWCNVSGAGIGERPQTLPFGNDSVIQAYVWIKPPGESDGTSDTTQTTPDDEGKSFDPMCSSSFVNAGGVLTGAMDNAPSAGAWFHEQFKMLVENANPAL